MSNELEFKISSVGKQPTSFYVENKVLTYDVKMAVGQLILTTAEELDYSAQIDWQNIFPFFDRNASLLYPGQSSSRLRERPGEYIIRKALGDDFGQQVGAIIRNTGWQIDDPRLVVLLGSYMCLALEREADKYERRDTEKGQQLRHAITVLDSSIPAYIENEVLPNVAMGNLSPEDRLRFSDMLVNLPALLATQMVGNFNSTRRDALYQALRTNDVAQIEEILATPQRMIKPKQYFLGRSLAKDGRLYPKL